MSRRTLTWGAASLLALVAASVAYSAQPAPNSNLKLAHRDRLYDVTRINGELLAVGHPGLVLRSKDNGKSFQNMSVGQSDEALFSIAFNKKGQGAIVGRSGFVLLTDDGGKTFRKAQVQLGDEKPHLFAVDVLDDGSIVAVGEFGAIVRSEDGGKTFSRSSFSIELSEQPAAEGDACAAFAKLEGENSDMLPEARLTDVSFADDKHGVVVGEFGLVIVSDDGGRTFTRRNGCTDKTLYSVASVDAQHAIAVGAEGTVVETADGNRFEPRVSGSNEHLFGAFTDAKRAVVMGAAGTVLVREGQGAFKQVPTDVHSWLTSAALDEQGQGIIVGGRGNVLATRDGGKTLTRTFGE